MRIALEGVRKRFGRFEALRGVDLEIRTGERVALVGPNGSGKSTLLRVVLGLLRCGGRARLDDLDPRVARTHLAHRIAYVPQVAPQLGAPVREVVRAIAALRAIPLDRVGLEADAFALPLDAIAGRPFRALSGGMKQKLLLAVAFASRPSLFILDEPTASLDVATRAIVGAKLEALHGSPTTVLLCSHHVDDVRPFASRRVELEEGRVARDLELATSAAPNQDAREGCA